MNTHKHNSEHCTAINNMLDFFLFHFHVLRDRTKLVLAKQQQRNKLDSGGFI